jgi:hypothetical protein
LSTVQTTFLTVSCDGPGCTKSVTFPGTEQGQLEAMRDAPWLNSLRIVQTSDKRQLGYCSDECEANAVGNGSHNKLEKRIITATGQQVDLAARAAEQARQTNAALHQGSPVVL